MSSLVQRGDSLSGLDLIQAKGEGKATGQFLDAADVGRCPVQVGPLILKQLVEQLKHTRWKKVFVHVRNILIFKIRTLERLNKVLETSAVSHLLQTKDEGLGTKNLVDLSGLT